jgi:NAD(P)-dependent dehydrogenase (short-subunit alcohol dehydrogenase family)
MKLPQLGAHQGSGPSSSKYPAVGAIGVQGRQTHDDLSCLLHRAVTSMSVKISRGVAGSRRAALSAITAAFAKELAPQGIKVNAPRSRCFSDT